MLRKKNPHISYKHLVNLPTQTMNTEKKNLLNRIIFPLSLLSQNIPCKSHLFFYNTTYMGCLRGFSLHDKNVAIAKIEIRELHLQRLYSLL